MTEKCKLCVLQKDLQRSHAIQDSTFKKIFRGESGQAICVTSGNEATGTTQDSWAEHQLCLDCERKLNIEYEAYSLGILRGVKCKLKKSKFGITFSGLNQHKLIMYFLSIYWRAANSGHSAYKSITLLKRDNEYLRDAIFKNKKIPQGRFSIKISRAIDLTKNKTLTPEQTRKIILSPFLRNNKARNSTNTSVCFLFEGFFIEIYLKGLKLKDRYQPGILSKNKSQLTIPFLNLFDIKEFNYLVATAYINKLEGNVNLKAIK